LKKAALLLLSAILILSLISCAPQKGDESGLDLHPSVEKAAWGLNTYYIDAKLDTTNNKLICRQRMELANRTGIKLQAICFHLYPNAFASQDNAPFDACDFSRAYPNGFDPGGMDVTRVLLNGAPVSFDLSSNRQLLTLKHTWKKGKKVTVEMEYTVTIPNCLGRFGRGVDTYKLSNAYPVLCAYKGGWITDGYCKVGDPFFTEVSNYDVTITAPKSLIIAATGEEVKSESDGSFKRTRYMARAVRDFAWVASEKFSVLEKKVGRVTIASYTLEPTGGQEALETAEKALKCFNKLFGEYPYNRLNIVCADYFVGGMEYPMLIMLDRKLYTQSMKISLEYVTAHEVAHQWWYALVGNDQVNEPWLDEALTEYSTMLYFDTNYGENAYKNFFNICVVDRYKIASHDIENEKIDRPITEFADNNEYSAIVYSKGALMFGVVSEIIGKERFLQGLNRYYEKKKFGIAEKRDLINALEGVAGMRLDGIFDAWLSGKVVVE